ncbi:hypothetical protein GCT13_04105 [Paraburkholderia sp. CNPSo 3157]|uniref:Uncharacterized protein n=1 Tax=Paraburkholderia franconis TaxID=2654983 RepID=A0A7X1N698_9BURK|nr:hypothetical protein [Paraburkholderia franconis]MPW16130.1 hypothetical protein [Paraburkholderia franconis]
MSGTLENARTARTVGIVRFDISRLTQFNDAEPLIAPRGISIISRTKQRAVNTVKSEERRTTQASDRHRCKMRNLK